MSFVLSWHAICCGNACVHKGNHANLILSKCWCLYIRHLNDASNCPYPSDRVMCILTLDSASTIEMSYALIGPQRPWCKFWWICWHAIRPLWTDEEPLCGIIISLCTFVLQIWDSYSSGTKEFWGLLLLVLKFWIAIYIVTLAIICIILW